MLLENLEEGKYTSLIHSINGIPLLKAVSLLCSLLFLLLKSFINENSLSYVVSITSICSLQVNNPFIQKYFYLLEFRAFVKYEKKKKRNE